MTKASENSIPSGLLPRRPVSSPRIPHKLLQETPQKAPEQSGYEARPVPEALKDSLIHWLEDLGIFRKGLLNTQVLPSICSTGVPFCDLINRLEGKSEPIRGVERNPRNRTQALANINKALEYLRDMAKMSAKYLWSGKNIIEGEECVVWGLLEDIKNLFTATRQKPVTAQRPLSSAVTAVPRLDPEAVLPQSFLEQKSKVLRSYSASMKRSPNQSPSLTLSRISQPSSSKSMRESMSSASLYISEEMKKLVLEWVDALGLHHQVSSSPYTDSLKNGVLVCELVRILDSEQIKINPRPHSSQAIFDNFSRALAAFKKKHPELPGSLLHNPEAMTENPELVYSFIYSLYYIYTTAVPSDYSQAPLPYGAIAIKKLEESLTQWVSELQILQPPPCSFRELIPEFQSGVLLCVIISRALYASIPNIVREPTTEQACMSNIRKALDALRKIPKMSQKFVWSEKEILKGCCGVILGLLEDIHQCADGLSPRNPREDGPYLGKKPQAQKASYLVSASGKSDQEESFNATFGSKHSQIGDGKAEAGELDNFTQWLYEIGTNFPRSIRFREEHIPEFTTGTLLCGIVNALERVNLPGVDKEPKTRASAMQNINKAMGVIKKRKGFPSELRNCEEEVFIGNGSVIRRLMQALMKMYRKRG